METLKEQFFNPSFIAELSKDIRSVFSEFDVERFTGEVLTPEWKQRELKDRMRHITAVLHRTLPQDFRTAAGILMKVSRRRIKDRRTGFGDMVFPDFVEQFGLEDLPRSIDALELFTQACSSEFAVRPFIVRYPKEMMKQMVQWTKHSSTHVRRLASEGCRPRLPWAMALPEFKKDPSPILPVLERLKDDPSEYVRRSVANNLNDISKDHPALVLSLARKWAGKSAEVDAVLKHALRTELKKGNPAALRIFGFGSGSAATVSGLRVDPSAVKIGGSVHFHFVVHSKRTETLRLEYRVYFVKRNGSSSPKVFQVEERPFKAGSSKEYRRKHNFKDLTTRKHHPGKHRITIAVNGKEKASVDVMVKK